MRQLLFFATFRTLRVLKNFPPCDFDNASGKRAESPVCLPSNTNAEITMKKDIGNENARNKKKIVP